MKTRLLLFILPLLIVLVGAGCTQNTTDNIISNDDSGIENTDDVSYVMVQGSCNMIDLLSHCEEYIGSYWTEEAMQLQCEGVGTWSENVCPPSEYGGCNAMPGTEEETVLWAYSYGGEPLSADDAEYEAMACNANPQAQWVISE